MSFFKLRMSFNVAVLIGFTWSSSGTFGNGAVHPLESKVRVIQFDAIIEFELPRNGRHTFWFVRYWVSRKFYSLAITWSEPPSRALLSARSPLGFVVHSDTASFRFRRNNDAATDTYYRKPLGDRGVFSYRYGDYPITDIRFAEAEAFKERVYAADLESFFDSGFTGERFFSLPDRDEADKRFVTALRVNGNKRIVDSIELFGKDGLTKTVENKYENNQLHRKMVFSPERPLIVSLQNEGATVKLNEQKYLVKQFPVADHKGGRTAIIDYFPVAFGTNKMTLPTHIDVNLGKTNRFLRSASLTNFQLLDLTCVQVEEIANQFCINGFYCEKGGKTDSENLSSSIRALDFDSTEQGRIRKPNDTPDQNLNLGLQLKHFHVLMQTNQLEGDDKALRQNFQRYLSTLFEWKLPRVVLEGGYEIIEASMTRRRYGEVGMLLDQWIEMASKHVDFTLARNFVATQLKNGNFFVAIKFLEKYENGVFSPSIHYEIAAMKCISVYKLKMLMQRHDSLKFDLAKAQTEMAAIAFTDEKIEKMLLLSLEKAKETSKSLGILTDFQKFLKAEVQKIIEINKTNLQISE